MFEKVSISCFLPWKRQESGLGDLGTRLPLHSPVWSKNPIEERTDLFQQHILGKWHFYHQAAAGGSGLAYRAEASWGCPCSKQQDRQRGQYQFGQQKIGQESVDNEFQNRKMVAVMKAAVKGTVRTDTLGKMWIIARWNWSCKLLSFSNVQL